MFVSVRHLKLIHKTMIGCNILHRCTDFFREGGRWELRVIFDPNAVVLRPEVTRCPGLDSPSPQALQPPVAWEVPSQALI